MTSSFELKLVGVACLVCCASSWTQSIAQTIPNAGQIQRQLQMAPIQQPLPNQAAMPAANAGGHGPNALSSGDEKTMDVHEIHITGATVFASDSLQALVSDVRGKQTLQQLQSAAARISEHYQNAGFLLARAYLPQQRIEDGRVTIAVLEGKVGVVQIDDSSRLGRDRVQERFADIKDLGPLTRQAIDRRLLLLGDLPGVVNVQASLSPGQSVGEADIQVHSEAGPVWSGRLEASNHGSLYTGSQQFNAQIHGNNLTGRGDHFGLNGMRSSGDLTAWQLAYDMPLSNNGLQLGVSSSLTHYALGDAFRNLQAHGMARTDELSLSYPLVRQVQKNLAIRVSGSKRSLHDAVDSTSTDTDKTVGSTSLRILGDARDTWGGLSAVTFGGIGLTHGSLHIDTASRAALDAIAARTAGAYTAVQWNLERQQSVGGTDLWVASMRGQLASKNLDSSEKFSLGGPSAVRAYATSEAVGDEGWLLSLEWRRRVAEGIALTAFYDTGHVRVNKQPFLATPNQLNRSGAGVGILGNWGSLDLKASVAWRAREAGTAEPDKSPRAWVQLGWVF
jgi:hemolysin activation/secretion protein